MYETLLKLLILFIFPYRQSVGRLNTPNVCNADLTKATCQLSIPSNSLFPVSKYNCLSSVKESLHTAAASELGSVFITPNYGDG